MLAGHIALASLLAVAGVGEASAAEPLQPFQMVRSLQLVQDRIAAGDHAALPMQKKLLEMIDGRFRAADEKTFEERKNFHAMLVYGMSGGNPATLERAMHRLTLEGPEKSFGDGIVDYLNGRPKLAQQKLASADPMALPPELGAFVALVKGALLTVENPKGALDLFDTARLLAPGTLVEEAALRRSIALGITLKDQQRFLRASGQYVRRYLRSPYASQFADSFVSGVLAFHEVIKDEQFALITALMDAEQEKVIYLRIARRAAIDGMHELSEFASARAEGKVDPEKGDPRAELYSSLATVTSGNAEDVVAKLDGIDREKLSLGDRQLLDAARKVAGELVTAAVPEKVTEPPIAGAADLPKKEQPLAEPDAADTAADQAIDAIEPDGSTAEESAPEAPAPAETVEAPTLPVPAEAIQADHKTAPEPGTPEATVVDARQKLQAIDALLEEAPK